jgi:hypothetical protein
MCRFMPIVIIAFIVCSCQGKMEKSEHPIVETIITSNGVIFNENVLINGISYLRQTEVEYSMNYDVVRWIHQDTILYEVDELFVAERIFDVNGDGLDDLVVIYNATQGKQLFICYLFDKNLKKMISSGGKFFIERTI